MVYVNLPTIVDFFDKFYFFIFESVFMQRPVVCRSYIQK